jgi:GTP-binding protein Era
MEMEKTTAENFRAGYVAIIGEPNVGKSTLMNGLLEQKISIVTSKPQTTRHKILGILTQRDYQIVFLDTPGLLIPKYLLHEAMMEFARSAIEDADIVLFMIDARDPKADASVDRNAAFRALKDLTKPVSLIINKVDLVDKKNLLPVIDFYSKKYPFKEIFPISALKRDGLSDLLGSIVTQLPLHPPYYPDDAVSDQSERFFVAEIVREKIFEKFREEIPYSTTVEIVEFREAEGKKDFISAEVYVERDSQKQIVIGRGGAALKEIGQSAREDIEAFLERPVFLELHVKVREKWRNSEAWLRRLGYRSS